MTRAVKSLVVLAAFGAMTTGCQDDSWYENWYEAEVDAGSPDPTYDSSLSFEGAYYEAAFLGCLNRTDDADFISAFGYNPASMPENFWLWYGYAEFQGVAGGGNMTVQWNDPSTGAVTNSSTIYLEYGGSAGASAGFFDGGDGACDYLAPNASSGDFLFCDYFYADALYAVSSCGAALPTEFNMIISVSDLLDPDLNASVVITEPQTF